MGPPVPCSQASPTEVMVMGRPWGPRHPQHPAALLPPAWGARGVQPHWGEPTSAPAQRDGYRDIQKPDLEFSRAQPCRDALAQGD